MNTIETPVLKRTNLWPEHKHSTRSAFWQLFGLIRPYYWLMGLTIGAGVLNSGAAIAGAGVGAYLVGAAATGTRAAQLVPALFLLGCLVGLQAIMAWVEMWLAHDLAYRVLAEIRTSLYQALDRLAPSYLLERRSGDLAAAAMSDVETLEWFYAHTVGSFVVAVIVALTVLLLLAVMHPLLPLVLLLPVVGVATVPFWFVRCAVRQGQALRTYLGEVNAEVVDGVQGLREIVTFGQGTAQLNKLSRQNRMLLRAQFAHGRRSGLEGAITSILISLGLLSVLALAATFVAHGMLAASLLPVSVILAGSIFAPIMSVTNAARNMGIISASANRVFTVLHTPAPVEDHVTAPPSGPIEPRVQFEQVTFRYGPELPEALTNVSFTLVPGETVALVGHSGAGKSTCAHLLLRFWDVQEGAITIGGHDLRDFPQATVRDLITLVPQDTYLFNASIAENIRLGKPQATDVEVKEAAREALIHDFILTLPQGYATQVGERGAQLSGGQRQRIAIARAVLKDAPILVLDEAVSNLDTENERALQAAMTRLRARRTTLVIAHRLSTIRTADRLVVLEHGQVAEVGTHDEQVARGGVYARLIASQRDGLLPT
ncbi:MAG TPA: thiol reductant ABC exporter subunit CydC [Ktedonobacteraceae bacterium]|nr:thiol reductant ABC exporter subunit CydC [Ktedonobacteraceae bacterium]